MTNKMMKFENSDIAVEKINGVWMFELYAVGMALGQVKKNAKGTEYPFKERIDKNCEKADIKPCVRGVHKYLTESQVYDLMLETRTDKCRAFRKWLTNEVLPELNHKGSYSIKKQPNHSYKYFDKTWKGEPVLSTIDVFQITGIDRTRINAWLRNHGVICFDYYNLKGKEIEEFKTKNPDVAKNISEMNVITKSGFMSFCKAYNVKIEEPKCFAKPENHDAPWLPNGLMLNEIYKIEKSLMLAEKHSKELIFAKSASDAYNAKAGLNNAIMDLCRFASEMKNITI